MIFKFLLLISLLFPLLILADPIADPDADFNTDKSEHHIAPQSIDGASVVSATQVVEMVSTNKKSVLIDSRYVADRKQGYIQGSIALPNTQTNCNILKKHISDKAHPVIFYCNGVSCKRSEAAVKIALGCGYRQVFWFRGGLDEWIINKFPYVKE